MTIVTSFQNEVEICYTILYICRLAIQEEIILRLIALAILVIPGILATYGIKLMRDAFFGELTAIFFHIYIQFFIGLFLFVGGILFIGGFILHRDRKRQLTKGEKNNRYKHHHESNEV